MTPMVTLNHFTLPTWLHDPIAVRDAFAGVGPDDPPPAVARGGWLNQRTVAEFGRFAAWAAWRYGDQVDLWVTINEPMVVAVNGYVNVAGAFAGWFPPGVYSFPAAVRVLRNLAKANALAYDAVHGHDRHARVGPVQNMIAFTPAEPGQRGRPPRGRARRLRLQPRLPQRRRQGARRRERRRPHRGRRAACATCAVAADFIGVNYYFRSRVTGLPGAGQLHRRAVRLPARRNTYRHPQNPTAPPCPTTCTEFGAEVYPQGFRTRAARRPAATACRST